MCANDIEKRDNLWDKPLNYRVHLPCHSLVPKCECFPENTTLVLSPHCIKLPCPQYDIEDICEFRCTGKIDSDCHPEQFERQSSNM